MRHTGRSEPVRNPKPLVYVAGPYSHPDPVLNVRRAVAVAELMPDDVVPIIPHLTMLWHLVSPHEIDWWYEYDLHVMARCDAVYRFAGASAGADREVAVAKDLGIPVVTNMADLLRWLGHWLGER